MVNIVLFGPPGAGKGTQSTVLAEEYRLKHICPGNILRNEVSKKTSLGKKVQAYIDQGLLVPNELIVAVVAKSMKRLDQTKGFLFDGYPRTYLQATALDKQLQDLYKSALSLVVVLQVDDQEAQKRIRQRGKLFHRADDQSQTIITGRMRTYQETTLPVLRYYKQQNKVVKIEGKGTLDQVTLRLKRAISIHLSL